MPLRHALLGATLAGLVLTAPALAQAPEDPAAQAAQDQQIDLALGMLAAPNRLTLVLMPPQQPGTRGPLRFDQEPPAALNDFGDETVRTCPRRGSFGNC